MKRVKAYCALHDAHDARCGGCLDQEEYELGLEEAYRYRYWQRIYERAVWWVFAATILASLVYIGANANFFPGG